MDASDFILPDFSTQQNHSQGTKRNRVQENIDRATIQSPSSNDNSLWIDKYSPKTESQIGVTSGTVKKLKKAFEQSALQKGETKLLVLTGPTGSGKSTLLKLLCKGYGYEIAEWFTPDRSWSADQQMGGHIQVFKKFMLEATYLNTLDSLERPNKGKVILLDDLPDLTTDTVKTEFYSILQQCLSVQHKFLIVIIATDAYIETNNSDGGRKDGLARVLATDNFLKHDFRVNSIEFNSIPNTQIKKVLNSIASCENLHLPNSQMENLIDTSNGDIRQAINSLQFFSNQGSSSSYPIPKKRRNDKGEVIVDFMRHTGHLSLFHAVGKVLYAKRNVDGTFESNPEHIISKIPKGNDGFIDYLHQNCIEFFDEIEHCAKALEDISNADTLRSTIDWQDSIGGLYRNFVSINGIMKNRTGKKQGLWRELAGPMFNNNLKYDLLKRQREEYYDIWMESVSSRSKQYEESNPEVDMSVFDPVEPFSSDEDGFDDIFGDGSELEGLDF